MKKRAAVTIETERLLVISRSRGSIDIWCAECAASVAMVNVQAAAAIAGISEREIFQRGESGAIHFSETAEGKALFCVASILKHRGSGAEQLPRSTKSNQKG